jgi:hypothetical protein
LEIRLALTLKFFGVQPGQIVFIDLKSEKDVLWTVEETFRCNSITAVIRAMMRQVLPVTAIDVLSHIKRIINLEFVAG